MADRRPAAPGIAYTALAIVMLVLVATFALTSRQPPPPTIAEFAPQAVENISDAPSDQSSSSGRSGGAGGGGAAETVAEATPTPPPPVDVPRVRRCVGDPPRQIEDHQSPPCVPYWEGDNGGATSKGVTADEIIVALPVGGAQQQKDLDAFTTFFNKRFEFYGRKIRLEVFKPNGGSAPAVLVGDAVKVDEEIGAFASLAYNGGGRGAHFYYYDELARRKVVSVSFDPTYVASANYVDHHPYQWTYFPEFDVGQRSVADWICSSLSGRPARYGGPDVLTKTRVFGLIYEPAAEGAADPDPGPLRAKLRSGCNESFKVDVRSDGVGAQNALLQMRSEGVTSIVCICAGDFTLGRFFMQSAQNQGYTPEWLLSSYLYQDNEFTARQWPADQAQHAFGLTFNNKFFASSDMPWGWAINEVDPSAGGSGWDIDHYTYENFLQLASGLQMAGPRLTPETFAQGLARATFPNPGCKGPPMYQACVAYPSGDHAMQNDAALIWWGAAEISAQTFNTAGTHCFVRRGERYVVGGFPADDAGFFDKPCY